MAITRTPIVDDDGTGTTGTVIDNAWKTELYNQIDGVSGGAWVTVPFNPANFWSDVTGGMVAVNRYMVINKTMWWQMQIGNCTVPNPLSAYLPFTLPVGYYVQSTFTPAAYATDSGGTLVDAYLITLNASSIGAFKTTGANWLAYPCAIYFTAVLSLL